MTQTQNWQPSRMEALGLAPGEYNGVVEVKYRRGWAGFFSGESQTRALQRCLPDVNGHGFGVAAAVTDQWWILTRVLWWVIAIVTLGFIVRGPNVLLITYPLPRT